MNPKCVLILHGLDRTHQANLISQAINGRLFPYGAFTVKTLESVILSGRPLNMKAEIDNAFAVIIMDHKNLFIDTLTGFSVKYANQKSIFVSIGNKTEAFIFWSWGFPSLRYGSDPHSPFWRDLREQLSRLFNPG